MPRTWQKNGAFLMPLGDCIKTSEQMCSRKSNGRNMLWSHHLAIGCGVLDISFWWQWAPPVRPARGWAVGSGLQRGGVAPFWDTRPPGCPERTPSINPPPCDAILRRWQSQQLLHDLNPSIVEKKRPRPQRRRRCSSSRRPVVGDGRPLAFPDGVYGMMLTYDAKSRQL
jgi:hypothetical protein